MSAAFPGGEEIAEARDLTRSFLADLQADHGLQIGARTWGMVKLVVSELVTNVRKDAPARGCCRSSSTGEALR
jgi:hypothetical protein